MDAECEHVTQASGAGQACEQKFLDSQDVTRPESDDAVQLQATHQEQSEGVDPRALVQLSGQPQQLGRHLKQHHVSARAQAHTGPAHYECDDHAEHELQDNAETACNELNPALPPGQRLEQPLLADLQPASVWGQAADRISVQPAAHHR